MNIKQVKDVWNQHLPRLEQAFIDFNWEDEKTYAQYLAQTYRYITHSCQLLRYAAENTKNEALRECLYHHDAEEDGHENLALNDLKRLGYSLDEIPELPVTQQIYGIIYKQIDSHGPAAIVGYALALEGLSARRCPEIAKRLINRYGALKSTLIKLHGDVDPGHIHDSFNVLQHFSEAELDIVAQVMMESVNRYVEYLAALQLEAAKQNALVGNGNSVLDTAIR